MLSCVSLNARKVRQSLRSQCEAKHKRIQISIHYYVISIIGNQKCLLLCFVKEGKAVGLECQANFAIFVF